MQRNMLLVAKPECLTCHHLVHGLEKQSRPCYNENGCAATEVLVVVGADLSSDVTKVRAALQSGDVSALQSLTNTAPEYSRVVTKLAQDQNFN